MTIKDRKSVYNYSSVKNRGILTSNFSTCPYSDVLAGKDSIGIFRLRSLRPPSSTSHLVYFFLQAGHEQAL
jgi:hypothetical protein